MKIIIVHNWLNAVILWSTCDSKNFPLRSRVPNVNSSVIKNYSPDSSYRRGIINHFEHAYKCYPT